MAAHIPMKLVKSFFISDHIAAASAATHWPLFERAKMPDGFCAAGQLRQTSRDAPTRVFIIQTKMLTRSGKSKMDMEYFFEAIL